ncbi:hypothetical protein TA17A_24 [Mycobacterium phage TA17A]|uniref:Uncharacterized protein n=1 Tax=Mycobacterium phage TA17A TaxID=2928684 RepID=S5VLS0_9CAUD|nr:hypothetical protein FPF50_gp24 [Mycobacterium phage TA17A]AGS81433.1 hypothetical protein TA17A_24 [Mycobacterium phage TA17A]
MAFDMSCPFGWAGLSRRARPTIRRHRGVVSPVVRARAIA